MQWNTAIYCSDLSQLNSIQTSTKAFVVYLSQITVFLSFYLITLEFYKASICSGRFTTRDCSYLFTSSYLVKTHESHEAVYISLIKLGILFLVGEPSQSKKKKLKVCNDPGTYQQLSYIGTIKQLQCYAITACLFDKDTDEQPEC